MKPFSLADVYKNVETIKSARHSNRLAQTNQQLENEKMLHMAATDIARDPSTADRHIPQLVQAGILNQSAVKEMSPQQLQEGARQILASTTATLKAMNALDRKPVSYGKTPTWGLDNQGNPIPILVGDDGTMKQPEMPPGVKKFVDPPKFVGVGDKQLIYGSRSGEKHGEVSVGLPPEKKPENILLTAEAEDTARIISASREKLGIIHNMNGRYAEAIKLSQNGANTGPIERLLPTFKAQTAALEHLQKEMGLDIIGAVTFGALSKSEMDVAMQTALPTNLDGPDLVKWLKKKQVANNKLAFYLRQQIDYLKKGGTIEGWMANQQSKRGSKPINTNPQTSQRPGGESMDDPLGIR